MKFLTQVVLPILLVVALIGGVTFISQYGGLIRPSKKNDLAPGEAAFELNPGLMNGEAVADWNQLYRPAEPEFEIYTKHHYDFSMRNRGQTPLTVGLTKKSCSCASVGVTSLSADEAEQLAVQGPAWADALEAGDRWQELDTEGTRTATVPAGGWALVRMTWQASKLERLGLRARLWIDRGVSGRDEAVLVVPVRIVPAIRVHPLTVKVAELTARDPEQKIEFFCWSSTRASFPLTVREESDSPCIVCRTTPLTEEQRRKLSREQNCGVLAGYRVTVTITERRGEQQLDLGPFRRRVLLQAGIAENESATVILEGMVRGEVKFQDPGDKDRIDLGDFPARQGTRKTVMLVTEQEGQQLEVDSHTPAYLLARLVPAEGRRWNLTVEVPADGRPGRLPEDSAVIVRTKEGRRMRIPVVGRGTS